MFYSMIDAKDMTDQCSERARWEEFEGVMIDEKDMEDEVEDEVEDDPWSDYVKKLEAAS